jgi:hypothetical protein
VVVTTTAAAYDGDSRLAPLWSAFFAAPLAWAIDQGVGYAVMKPVCAGQARPLLLLLSAACLGVTAIAGAYALRVGRRLHATAAEDGGRHRDRDYFLAILAVALNALVALLVVTAAIPQLVVSPCE